MPDLLLGIDCSTTAAKAVAWDRGGKARIEGRASFEEVRPQPGHSEQRASRIGPSPRVKRRSTIREPLGGRGHS
jgi:xylulokinase